MDKLNVRIVKLGVMKVASFQAAGASPEMDAFKALNDWAYPKGLLHDLVKNPLFGFDSPLTVEGRKTRGYECWIKVPPDLKPEPNIVLKEFAGGVYLVATCSTFGNPELTIPKTWSNLHRWAQENGYEMGNQSTLERFYAVPFSNEFTIDLYYPVQIRVPGMTEDQYVKMIKQIDDDNAFKKLNTEQKIKKLKDNIDKIDNASADTEPEKGDPDDIAAIKAELSNVKEEIKSLKQLVNSLIEDKLSTKFGSPALFTCDHVNGQPHVAFIVVNKDGSRSVKCDASKPCESCIYKVKV